MDDAKIAVQTGVDGMYVHFCPAPIYDIVTDYSSM